MSSRVKKTLSCSICGHEFTANYKGKFATCKVCRDVKNIKLMSPDSPFFPHPEPKSHIKIVINVVKPKVYHDDPYVGFKLSDDAIAMLEELAKLYNAPLDPDNYNSQYLKRHDPILVKTVKKLGSEAHEFSHNNDFVIVKIPKIFVNDYKIVKRRSGDEKVEYDISTVIAKRFANANNNMTAEQALSLVQELKELQTEYSK